MLQVVGTLTGIESRNGGWSAIAILEEGNQYPKKLSTKKQELISQAISLMGNVVTAAYNESESNQINPHTSSPYINRYLEAIALGAVQIVQPGQQSQPIVQQQQVQQPVQQPVQQQQYAPIPGAQQTPQIRTPDDVREMRIMRQAAGKVAASLLPLLSVESHNLASLVAISEQLVGYFKDGVQWNVPAIQPTQGYENPAESEQPPVEPDDGIPF
jgi:hypothetical protein